MVKVHKLNASKRKEIMLFAVSKVIPDPVLTGRRVEQEILLASHIRGLHVYPQHDLEVLERYQLATAKHMIQVHLEAGDYNTCRVSVFGRGSEWCVKHDARLCVNLDIIPESTPLVVPHGIMEYGNIYLGADAKDMVRAYGEAIVAENHNKHDKLVAYQQIIWSIPSFEDLVLVWPEVDALKTDLWPARLPATVDSKALEIIKNDVRRP